VLTKTKYDTTTGKEIFLSFENEKENKLAAFLRLRLPEEVNENFYKEELGVLKDSALVRELHTYGQLKHIHEKGDQSQHVGLGRSLMNEAEIIAREAGYKKIAVISGIGVREYYRKLGYELEGTYMVKYL
jgi:elongator complex protein 3